MTAIRKSYTIVVVAFVAIIFSASVKAQLPMKKPGTIKEQINNSTLFNENKTDDIIADILDYASKFKGVRYRLGATGPHRFDCSGFTSYVFSHFGYKLNRVSRDQINNGKIIAKNELQPGDLVFFNGRRAGGSRIGHVGIVTKADNENETFEFIHASSSQGVVVSKSTETYFNKRYVSACRVIEEQEEKPYGADMLFDFRLISSADTIDLIIEQH